MLTRSAEMNDLHPLAGTEREPGWTVKDESDSLAAAYEQRDRAIRLLVAEVGKTRAIELLLT